MYHPVSTVLIALLLSACSPPADPPQQSARVAAPEQKRDVTPLPPPQSEPPTTPVAAHEALVRNLDLTEVPSAKQSTSVSEKQLEFRLLLADFPAKAFRLSGAKETVVLVQVVAVSEEYILEVARARLLKSFSAII